MNKDRLKKSIYHRVRLRPIAERRNGGGRLSPCDDDWIIQKVDDLVELSNVRTGHLAKLGLDHIHSYASDPQRDHDGLVHGFLDLNVQLIISGNKIDIEPDRRGGA